MVFETFPIGSLLTLIGACATELGGRLTMAFYRLIAAVFISVDIHLHNVLVD